MTTPFDITNPYTRRARLKPALIVVLPLGLAVLSWSSDGLKSLTVLWSLFVWAGGTALMTQLARDRGRQKEKELFDSWGGKPTTRLLRYAGSDNPVLVRRRHDALQRAISDIHIPTEAEEAADPHHADNVYDTCIKSLLEQTRDQKRFEMIFDENCNYGFRRNLWGMKPFGIMICILGIFLSSAAIFLRIFAHLPLSLLSYGTVALNLTLLGFWVLWCNPGWVKLAADAFGEILLAAVGRLEVELPKSAKASKATRRSDQ